MWSKIEPVRSLIFVFALASSCYAQLDVTYSGRLLGYMRYPDKQSPQARTCPSDLSKLSSPAGDFLPLKGKFGSFSLVVGMGDNFAPDLFARAFDGAPPDSPGSLKISYPGKDLFFWDGSNWLPDSAPGTPAIDLPMDNVGCFLRLAGYDAIVPGHEDFYFGPDRVRELARFLYGPDKSGQGLHRTAMLGANLSISSSAPLASPRLPAYYVQHGFEAENKAREAHHLPTFSVIFSPIGDEPAIGISLPDVPMPWLREFEIDNAFELRLNGQRVNAADLLPKSQLWDPKEVCNSDGNLVPAGTSHAKPCPLAKVLSTLSASPNGQDIQAGPDVDSYIVNVKARIDKVLLCKNPSRDPSKFARPGDDGCTEVPEEDERGKKPLSSAKIMFQLTTELLKKDSNYAVCVHLLRPGKNDKDYACQPFYVAEPFIQFDRSSGRPEEGTKGNDFWGDDDPFIVKTINGQKVAVFGLLDPAIQSTIGRLNYGYLNTDKKYDTGIKVGGLGDAWSQAWQRCQLVSACKDDKTRKVLLAQMPAFKASQFIASLDSGPVIDLVIAQTDASHETGELSARRNNLGKTDQPNIVLTPGEIYSGGDPRKLTLKIMHATVNSTPSSHKKDPDKDAKNVDWSICNHMESKDLPSVAPPPAGPPTSTRSLRSLAETALNLLDKPHVNTTTWSNDQVLQRLALTVMQQRHHADIAMLQIRDLFEARYYGFTDVNPDNLQETLDRVFWTGDYALTVPLTGATVTSLMTGSAAFVTQDNDPLNTDLEKGRGLTTIGIFKEPAANQNWVVNGSFLDPAKLYSATMNDFLTLGDTGYSQLQTPAVPPPYRLADFPKLDSISAMVCRAIKDHVPGWKGATCLGEVLHAATFLDASAQQPSDTTKGYNAARQAWNYLWPPLKYHRLIGPFDGQNDAELKAQQRPYWSLEVEKGDFGLNLNIHRRFNSPAEIAQGQAQSLNNAFSGAQIAAVTAPNSYAISYDNRTRLKRSWQYLDWYALDDLSYSYTRTQDATDDNYTRALAMNSAVLESGTLFHLIPAFLTKGDGRQLGRKVFQVDFLGAVRFETEPLSPREDISLPGNVLYPGCSATGLPPGSVTCGDPKVCPVQGQNGCTLGIPPGTIRGSLARSRNLYGKFGLRATDDRSWLESGLLAGHAYNLPYELTFNGMPSSDFAYFDPGQCPTGSPYLPANPSAGICQPNAQGEYPMPPLADHRFQDWITYLNTNNLINSNSHYQGIYLDRPQNGLFLNFSLNFPLPFGDRYTRRDGGKGLAYLAENSGQLFFEHRGDLATQTRYYDKIAQSLVIPVLGNFSIKPEIDFIFYEDKVFGTPFRSVQYLVNFSYTFAWRQGQGWRSVFYATPTPTASVPTSGR